MRVWLISAALAAATIAPAAAQIRVTVNGEPVQFEGAGPQEVNGRVLVPLRGVLEKLGAYVDWNAATHTVVATKGNLDLQLPIGSRTASLNGREVSLDVPAMTVAGSTMVPLRFVGETLGADVSWRSETNTVMIETGSRVAERQPQRDEERSRAFRRARTPVIDSVTYNVDGLLGAGQLLRARMRGTPGGTAMWRVRYHVGELPMREVTPGVYEGAWRNDSGHDIQIDSNDVLAVLRIGEYSSPEVTAKPGFFRRSDADGDRFEHRSTGSYGITDMFPGPEARVSRARPMISAVITGGPISRRRVRMLLDGRNVTDDAEIGDRMIRFTPDAALDPGRHVVELFINNDEGQAAHRTWSFFVPD